jgi:hypothetical protein
MAIRLRQSTASQEIPLGHFVDETDGKTPETALTINNTDIKLWKMGATALANKNSGGAIHMAGGVYSAVLDAVDTDTLGALVIFVQVSGALPVRVECEVLPANVYDSWIANSDKLQVDTVQVSGTNQTAHDIGATVAAQLDTNVSSRMPATTLAVKKNAALNNFMFLMRQSGDHVTPATGLTVTAQRSIDGAAFAACANAVSEVGNGVYKINLAASDLNGTVITLKFTATGADQRTITIVTQP